jgi:uncharacterized protein with von Willebrand factor type A (vWA) domain
MFLNFFYELRKESIPVSTTELIDLIRALRQWETPMTPSLFYHLSRNVLIKDIRYFDAFHLVFWRIFGNSIQDTDAFEKILSDWLSETRKKILSPEEMEKAPRLDNLWEELKKRLIEQKERHDGGNRWIGTGGTSPFGNSGFNPEGVRMGAERGSGMAIDSLEIRNYKDYREDITLGVREIQTGLRMLRELKKEGRKELSIPKTIDATCRAGGDPEIIEEKSRKNSMRLVLLMDIGGSMTPYSLEVSRIFSAVHQIRHFKEFHHYYFHNCVYDYVFEDSQFLNKVSMGYIYKNYPKETRFVFVGDACMNPYELFSKRHAYFEYYYKSQSTKEEVLSGEERLKSWKEQFPYTIWLNPENKRYWSHETISAIWDILPMFPLTKEGLRMAVKKLKNQNP